MPERLAFGRPGGDAPVAFSDNRNPHLAWTEVPEGTRSFALACIDTDVPSRPDEVNREGVEVPLDLPRVEFTHWLMVDIPAELRELAEGACADGIVKGGKKNPPGPPGSRQGLNDYGKWFAGDPEMGGDWFGYDGPCPPWNDPRPHHYHFRLYALDLPRLELPERFGLAEFRRAIAGHVLAEAVITGVYSLYRGRR
ncbi:MAG: YbhB/YbcL family Raf kinase inhibitor-like protein [Xanthomonadales bacterium]|nr:YbhB/YbcL family Raf kinase inhibitor-like protein [Xanthomonadales bacterium]